MLTMNGTCVIGADLRSVRRANRQLPAGIQPPGHLDGTTTPAPARHLAMSTGRPVTLWTSGQPTQHRLRS